MTLCSNFRLNTICCHVCECKIIPIGSRNKLIIMLLEIGYKSKQSFHLPSHQGQSKAPTKGSKRLKAGQLPGCQQQKQVAHTSTSPKPQRVKLPYVATKYACENFKSMRVSHLAPAPTGYLGMKK